MAQLSAADAFNLALEHHDAGRFAEAESLYQQVVEQNPEDAEARYLLGVVKGQLGRYEEASELVAKAIPSLPADAEAFNNLGEFSRRAGKIPEALAAFRQALALNPNSPEANSNLGLALLANREIPEAIASVRRAIELNPTLAAPHAALGMILWHEGKLDESVAAYRQATALAPKNSEYLNALAATLYRMSRMDEAIAEFRKSLGVNPEQPEIHVQLSFALLNKGEFHEGLIEHEWRFKNKGYILNAQFLAHEPWDGSPLNGRTIILRSEQGLGDTIQFSRYAALVAECGGRVLLQCPASIESLMGRVNGVAMSVSYDVPEPAYDIACPLLSLPKIFGTTPETIPATVPYLSAEDELVSRWRGELAGLPGLKVGLVWRGNPKHPNDVNRSIPLAKFAQLFRIPGITLISLQKDGGVEEMPAAKEMNVVDLGEKYAGGSFDDTAAILKNLDLLISVDTAPVHLAGALAVKVWTLLPFIPDWRWMLNRQDSPWYPTMRLFRQPKEGDWNSVIRRVCEELPNLDKA